MKTTQTPPSTQGTPPKVVMVRRRINWAKYARAWTRRSPRLIRHLSR